MPRALSLKIGFRGGCGYAFEVFVVVVVVETLKANAWANSCLSLVDEAALSWPCRTRMSENKNL